MSSDKKRKSKNSVLTCRGCGKQVERRLVDLRYYDGTCYCRECLREIIDGRREWL